MRVGRNFLMNIATYPFGIVVFLASCTHASFRSAQLYSDPSAQSQYEARGPGKVAVATQGRYATDAAFEILERGGSLADAAVAVSFVLGVERPHSTGIGGGGFLVQGRPGPEGTQVEAWDFRERAPLAAHSEMYVDLTTGKADPQRSRTGPLASGVPGLVAGLYEFHRQHGKLAWPVVLEPAIRLARDGFDVYDELAQALGSSAKVLARFPETRKIFFHSIENRVLQKGERLLQADLAKTLSTLAREGGTSFYTGSIAKKILAEAPHIGLLFTRADFKQYEVKKREPVRAEFQGHTIYSMPPPSSGGVHVIQILKTLEKDPLKKWGALDPRTVHLVSSAMQQAFVDRAHFMGDPDFVTVPAQELMSEDYTRSVRERIPIERARGAQELKPGPFETPRETDHTVHFSIIDDQGHAIASTQTINGHFGSGVVVRGTGILLNNEMDDFAAAVGASNLFGALASSEANLVEPGKTPLSSMSPTLVEKDGQLMMALGSPSGTRILTCVAQVLLNRIVFDMSPAQSVAQIRYHHQWSPDEIRVDEPGFSGDLEKQLRSMGHRVRTSNLGCRVQLVERDPSANSLSAVSDIRGEGSARVGH
jgi:gamma-glutamyltranspeptidase / glutathione hydrolase